MALAQKFVSSPIAASNIIGSREVGGWSVVLLSVAFWANILRTAGTANPTAHDSVITAVLDNGVFDVFAWVLVYARITRMFEAGAASKFQICAAFLVGVIVLAPVRLATAVALVILGGLLLRDRRALPAGRQVGMILLGLAVETVWTSPLLMPLHLLVGRMDAHIDAFVLGMLNVDAIADANVVNNISTNFSIAVWPYCTSSLPLGGVCLAFLVMVLYLGQALQPRHLIWLGMSLIGSILLTEIRLVLMATDPASYHWWHYGPGISVYVIAALAMAVVFPILATRNARAVHVVAGSESVA